MSSEGGFALVWIDGLLFIPLVMAAFFYPMQVLALVGGVLLTSFVAYEGWVFWRKKHPRSTAA